MPAKIIRIAEELSDCLLRNDPTIDRWIMDFRGTNAWSEFEDKVHSIVLHAPGSFAVQIIDLSLRRISSVRAAAIAEMLSLLPNLRQSASPPARKDPPTHPPRRL